MLARPPRRGMRMLDATLYAARHKATKQQRQNKTLFSDIAMGAFRGKKKGKEKKKVPPPPTTHIRKGFLKKKVKFVKGAGNWRLNLGAQTWVRPHTVSICTRPTLASAQAL